MNDYKFGNFVCKLREKKGLTQTDIANQLNITPAAVSKWENGSAKPRTEILFKLAQILEVSPEELMAGEYLEKESLSPESIKKINERYEYIVRVDAHSSTSVKMRRILAWIVDWNIAGVTAMLLFCLLTMAFGQSMENIPMPLIFLFILSFPILFICRDLFFGKSLGKRIFRLTILDKQTGDKAKASKRLLRNIFFLISEADVIVMLISGFTIGDYAAHTVVVPTKNIKFDKSDPSKANIIQDINTYTPPEQKTSRRKKFVIIVSIISAALLFCLLSYIMVSLSLEQKKNTEEYKLSYNYLIQSQKFKDLNIDEDKVRLKEYSYTTYTDKNGNKEVSATIVFRVGILRNMQVVCHEEDGVWFVCEDCTEF